MGVSLPVFPPMKRPGARRRKGGTHKKQKPVASRKSSVSTRAKNISPEKLAELLIKQRDEKRNARVVERATAAARKFRPRKSERGRIVFIGTNGSRTAAAKGRKGYAVYVTKTGKKQIVKDFKRGYKPQKISEIEFKVSKSLKTAKAKFQTAKSELLTKGTRKAPVRKSGSVRPGNQWDFSDKVVDKIANSLHEALTGQKSRRTFNINAMVLVKKPDGTLKTYNVQVGIARPDHLAIEFGGIKNFVSRKFYAFLARQLAFDGYVTSGSANHVRYLPENQGLERDEWTKNGEVWEGHDYDTVKIQQIEWKIEQQ
jgi:hypothetical protein